MGEYTNNEYFYKPAYGASGEDEKSKFDSALDGTDTEIQAQRDEFDTHKVDSDAHHTRYTDAEAQSTVKDNVKLDNLVAPDDNTDLDASSTAHGLLPKLPDDATKQLDGSGNWSTVVNDSITEGNTDTAPSEDAVHDALANKAALTHATRHQSGGADAIKLDDLASPDDNTDLDASSTAHGLLPKLPDDATKRLDGTGSWVDGGDVLKELVQSEVTINGATTLTSSAFGVMHKVTDDGSSTQYTITLPDPSGNAGKFIGFRGDSTSNLTRFIKVAPNGSESVGGLSFQCMHAEKGMILYCDGTDWKITSCHDLLMVDTTLNLDNTMSEDEFQTWVYCMPRNGTQTSGLTIQLADGTYSYNFKIYNFNIYIHIFGNTSDGNACDQSVTFDQSSCSVDIRSSNFRIRNIKCNCFVQKCFGYVYGSSLYSDGTSWSYGAQIRNSVVSITQTYFSNADKGVRLEYG